jgi:hypothetical protein
MRMRIFVVTIVFVGIFIMNQSCSKHFPCGVFVNRANKYDTLKLYPNGRFEQIVYNRQLKLVYHSISKWEKTLNGISIDSILLYDNIDSLYTIEEDNNQRNAGMNYDGFEYGYDNGVPIIYWKDYVDNPESARIFELVRYLDSPI